MQRRRADDSEESCDYKRRAWFPRPSVFAVVATVVGSVGSVVGMLSGTYIFLSSRDVEISLLKAANSEMHAKFISYVEHQRRIDEGQSRELRDSYTLVRGDISEINRKLDRAIEERIRR